MQQVRATPTLYSASRCGARCTSSSVGTVMSSQAQLARADTRALCEVCIAMLIVRHALWVAMFAPVLSAARMSCRRRDLYPTEWTERHSSGATHSSDPVRWRQLTHVSVDARIGSAEPPGPPPPREHLSSRRPIAARGPAQATACVAHSAAEPLCETTRHLSRPVSSDLAATAAQALTVESVNSGAQLARHDGARCMVFHHNDLDGPSRHSVGRDTRPSGDQSGRAA
jgi:hypothetical protein